jgi:hypothetical protein
MRLMPDCCATADLDSSQHRAAGRGRDHKGLCDKALDDGPVRKRLSDLGCEIPDKSRRGQAALASLVKSEVVRWSTILKAANGRRPRCSVVGAPQTVQHGLQAFIAQTGADELIVATQFFNHRARLRSYKSSRRRMPLLAVRRKPYRRA